MMDAHPANAAAAQMAIGFMIVFPNSGQSLETQGNQENQGSNPGYLPFLQVSFRKRHIGA